MVGEVPEGVITLSKMLTSRTIALFVISPTLPTTLSLYWPMWFWVKLLISIALMLAEGLMKVKGDTGCPWLSY